MKQEHRIRLGNTESVNSLNTDNFVGVNINHTTKPYLFTSEMGVVDQYEVYEKERDRCKKYRLITTIRPYCTNILFNPVTEIVKYNGSENVKRVYDWKKEDLKAYREQLFGDYNPDRKHMIRNTEYSSEQYGYEYLVGYDIFNNHLLRNKSFKLVIPPTDPDKKVNNETIRTVFNTLRDVMRKYDGENVDKNYKTRLSVSEYSTEPVVKHLYDYDDIMDLSDAINTYLTEENGWFGFTNKTTVMAKKHAGQEKSDVSGEYLWVWEEQDFNHVINSKGSCDFIDMYPDRTLFSFNPKYNEFKRRPEYNWLTYITYPYRNWYEHRLVKDAGLNALYIESVVLTRGKNGEALLRFKTICKHNLKQGNLFALYYKKEGSAIYERLDEELMATSVGDNEEENLKYYFSTTNLDLLISLGLIDDFDLSTDGNSIDDINEELSKITFRFRRYLGDAESEYYIRIFKKVPNFKRYDGEIDLHDIVNRENFEKILDDNNIDGEFDREHYQLAFSSTIYNDKVSQITFIDSIDTSYLIDNRSRPVSELYMTIVKNNKGNETWYNDEKIGEYEFSHCFGKLDYGFEYFDTNIDNRVSRSMLSDIRTIHNVTDSHASVVLTDYLEFHKKNGGQYDFGFNNLIREPSEGDKWGDYLRDDEFIGDVVEFNINETKETVLCEGQCRFNTYLRENRPSPITVNGNKRSKFSFTYDSFMSDDDDRDGFNVEEITDDYAMRPEGYFYKMHYPFSVSVLGQSNQASHFDIRLISAKNVNIGNKLYTVFRTALPHRLDKDGSVLLCDDERDSTIVMPVSYVFDNLTFAIGDYEVYENGKNVVKLKTSTICDIINGKYAEKGVKFKVRRYNEKIPYYAEKVSGKNKYIWKDIERFGTTRETADEEYPFTNGYFYVNQQIDFFLKRQDPFGIVGLNYTGKINTSSSVEPNDVFGNITPENDYIYKPEDEVTC